MQAPCGGLAAGFLSAPLPVGPGLDYIAARVEDSGTRGELKR